MIQHLSASQITTSAQNELEIFNFKLLCEMPHILAIPNGAITRFVTDDPVEGPALDRDTFACNSTAVRVRVQRGN